MYANLVVGISGLAADRDAVALAKALAARDGVLTLVNVRLVGTVPAKGSTGAYEASESEHSYELLQCQRQAYAKEADVVSVAAVTVGAGLHHVAENLAADLIVVGGCHRGPVGRVLAGDDARAALHHAPCAVAVAPRGHGKRAAPIRTIGVAYDGSEPGEVALAHSALLAMELWRCSPRAVNKGAALAAANPANASRRDMRVICFSLRGNAGCDRYGLTILHFGHCGMQKQTIQ